VFIIENNLANEAVHIRNMIRDREDCTTFWQSKDRPGIRKDHSTTESYVKVTEDYLRFDKLLFSTSLFTNTRKMTANKTKTALKEELERYSIKITKTSTGKVKREIGGKIGGANDDLAIAVMQAINWGLNARGAPPNCFG
jgi:hypothetical protein